MKCLTGESTVTPDGKADRRSGGFQKHYGSRLKRLAMGSFQMVSGESFQNMMSAPFKMLVGSHFKTLVGDNFKT